MAKARGPRAGEWWQQWQRRLEEQPVEGLGRRPDGLLEEARGSCFLAWHIAAHSISDCSLLEQVGQTAEQSFHVSWSVVRL
jgi:hypothetical protein